MEWVPSWAVGKYSPFQSGLLHRGSETHVLVKTQHVIASLGVLLYACSHEGGVGLTRARQGSIQETRVASSHLGIAWGGTAWFGSFLCHVWCFVPSLSWRWKLSSVRAWCPERVSCTGHCHGPGSCSIRKTLSTWFYFLSGWSRDQRGDIKAMTL